MNKTLILSIALVVVTGTIAGTVLGSHFNRFSEAPDGTRLPKVTALDNGLYDVTIPNDPKPTKSYVHSLNDNDTILKRAQQGDLVSIHFQVVSWDHQETREATKNLTTKPIKVEAGLDNASLMRGAVAKSNIIVPQHLSDALVGCAPGDRKLVIFPQNTPDLPVHLPREDAYALVVDIVDVH